jgi:hypothetical protein
VTGGEGGGAGSTHAALVAFGAVSVVPPQQYTVHFSGAL